MVNSLEWVWHTPLLFKATRAGDLILYGIHSQYTGTSPPLARCPAKADWFVSYLDFGCDSGISSFLYGLSTLHAVFALSSIFYCHGDKLTEIHAASLTQESCPRCSRVLATSLQTLGTQAPSWPTTSSSQGLSAGSGRWRFPSICLVSHCAQFVIQYTSVMLVIVHAQSLLIIYVVTMGRLALPCRHG